MTKQQTATVFALINKLKLKEHKEDIVRSISRGRTASTRELDDKECVALVKALKSQDKDEIGAEKMRRQIISLAHEMGWKDANQKADMKRIDDWCVKFGYKTKKLNQYLYNELPKLVWQFKEVYKHYMTNL